MTPVLFESFHGAAAREAVADCRPCTLHVVVVAQRRPGAPSPSERSGLSRGAALHLPFKKGGRRELLGARRRSPARALVSKSPFALPISFARSAFWFCRFQALLPWRRRSKARCGAGLEEGARCRLSAAPCWAGASSRLAVEAIAFRLDDSRLAASASRRRPGVPSSRADFKHKMCEGASSASTRCGARN
jgi:hypothetical protein